MQPHDNRAWIYVLPAVLVLAFVGLIPLVINTWHSFFDIFTLESKFWVGGEWYISMLTSARLYESLGRSFGFSLAILACRCRWGC